MYFSTRQQKLAAVMQAIANAEGFYSAGSAAQRANNPGGLFLGDVGYGMVKRLTVFASAKAGWRALKNQIELIVTGQSAAGYTPDMTISEVGQLWSEGVHDPAALVLATDRIHDPADLVLPRSQRVALSGFRGLSGAPVSPMAQAIATAEGFNVPGSIPQTAHNPGDLKIGDIGYGAINGITVFPTADAGWQATQNQIDLITTGQSTVYTPDMSISDVGLLWSGGDANWANNVAAAQGVDPSTSFSSVASGAASTNNDSSDSYSLISAPSNTTVYVGLGIAGVLVLWALTR